MRTFFNWQILQKIEHEPKKYLKQRSLSRLRCFLVGYELRLELKNYHLLSQKYDIMPTIEQFVLQKFNVKSIGTRHFTSLIGLDCEDERELLQQYFAVLHEYETAYPIEEVLEFNTTKPNDFDFEQKLHLIRLRPAMYFGNFELASLRAFFDGYFLALDDYALALTDYEKSVKAFLESIQSKKFAHIQGENLTWDRYYRFDRDFTAWGQGFNNEKIMAEFFTDLQNCI